MDAVNAFNQELFSLMDMKPPISRAKMIQITKAAIKAIKLYKHVVQIVEKFIKKCKPEYKVPGLYVVDSIVRQSRHQFGPEKDVFGPRFIKNLTATFQCLYLCPSEEKSKIVRVLNLWQKNGVFQIEIIQPLLDMAAIVNEPVPVSENSSNNEAFIAETQSSLEFQEEKENLNVTWKSDTSVDADQECLRETDLKSSPPQQWAEQTSAGPSWQEQLWRNAETPPPPAEVPPELPGADADLEPPTPQLPSSDALAAVAQLFESTQGQQLQQFLQTFQQPPKPQSPPVLDDNVMAHVQAITAQLKVPTPQQPEPKTAFEKLLDRFDYDDEPDAGDESKQSVSTPSSPSPSQPTFVFPGDGMQQPVYTQHPAQIPNIDLFQGHLMGVPADPLSHQVPLPPNGQMTGYGLITQPQYTPVVQPMVAPPPLVVIPAPPITQPFQAPFALQTEPQIQETQQPETPMEVEQPSIPEVKEPIEEQKKSQSRSASRSPKRRRSRSGSRSRRSRHKRSRSRSRDRRRHSPKSRSQERRERERERERRMKGFLTIKPETLTVYSTTLWIGQLDKRTAQQDVASLLEEFGAIESIHMIPPRGCAYIVMAQRTDAFRALQKLSRATAKVNQKAIKINWALNKGIKSEYKKFWNVELGVTYIPWNKVKKDDLENICEGGMLDTETLRSEWKEILKKPEKKEMPQNGGSDNIKSKEVAQVPPSVPIPMSLPIRAPIMGFSHMPGMPHPGMMHPLSLPPLPGLPPMPGLPPPPIPPPRPGLLLGPPHQPGLQIQTSLPPQMGSLLHTGPPHQISLASQIGAPHQTVPHPQTALLPQSGPPSHTGQPPLLAAGQPPPQQQGAGQPPPQQQGAGQPPPQQQGAGQPPPQPQGPGQPPFHPQGPGQPPFHPQGPGQPPFHPQGPGQPLLHHQMTGQPPHHTGPPSLMNPLQLPTYPSLLGPPPGFAHGIPPPPPPPPFMRHGFNPAHMPPGFFPHGPHGQLPPPVSHTPTLGTNIPTTMSAVSDDTKKETPLGSPISEMTGPREKNAESDEGANKFGPVPPSRPTNNPTSTSTPISLLGTPTRPHGSHPPSTGLLGARPGLIPLQRPPGVPQPLVQRFPLIPPRHMSPNMMHRGPPPGQGRFGVPPHQGIRPPFQSHGNFSSGGPTGPGEGSEGGPDGPEQRDGRPIRNDQQMFTPARDKERYERRSFGNENDTLCNDDQDDLDNKHLDGNERDWGPGSPESDPNLDFEDRMRRLSSYPDNEQDSMEWEAQQESRDWEKRQGPRGWEPRLGPRGWEQHPGQRGWEPHAEQRGWEPQQDLREGEPHQDLREGQPHKNMREPLHEPREREPHSREREPPHQDLRDREMPGQGFRGREPPCQEPTRQDFREREPPRQDFRVREPPHQDFREREPPHQDFREREPPRQDFRDRQPPHQDFKDRQPPHQDFRDRPPLHQDFRDRQPPHPEIRDRPPPHQDFRDRPPLHQDFRDRPPPHQDFRDRPPPHQDFRDRPPPNQDFRDRPPPHQDFRDRPPPHQDFRDRPPPHQDFRDRAPPHQDFRDRPPPHQDCSDSQPPRQDFRDREPPRQDVREWKPPKQDSKERELPGQESRGKEPPRQGPREGVPLRQGPREGVPPRQGPKEAYPPRQGPKEGDPPRQGPKEGDPPRQGPSEGEPSQKGPRDGETPRQGSREVEPPSQLLKGGELSNQDSKGKPPPQPKSQGKELAHEELTSMVASNQESSPKDQPKGVEERVKETSQVKEKEQIDKKPAPISGEVKNNESLSELKAESDPKTKTSDESLSSKTIAAAKIQESVKPSVVEAPR